MDISFLVSNKSFIDDFLTGVTDYVDSWRNIADFIGIITQFASGDFSELSSQGSLAGSFSGSGE